MLRQAQAASTKTLVQLNHPDWDAEAVDAEVGLILAENAMSVPDLGAPPDGDPAGVNQEVPFGEPDPAADSPFEA